ncbi:pentapeptide repeat-containing protein [Maribacter sp. 2307ULW6-5]|uniref:pentapeptide repeat-containing protein n=1 Tax=Maribacter sp. 2307ULW6-5 TaxID=3386275 RepID=UPI0039BD17C3
MGHKESIQGKIYNTEHQSEFKKDALNTAPLLYEQCTFQNFECDTIRDADYKKCHFSNLHFYWTLFNLTQFTQCSFQNCAFAGVTFAECKFMDCDFEDCKFIKDNLGRNCCFEGTTISNCRVDATSSLGFDV